MNLVVGLVCAFANQVADPGNVSSHLGDRTLWSSFAKLLKCSFSVGDGG